MNIWKPIVGFVTHKKVLSSIIGVALVGTVSAAGVAANKGILPSSPSAASSYSLPAGYSSHNSLAEEKTLAQLDSMAANSQSSTGGAVAGSSTASGSSSVSSGESSTSSAPSTPGGQTSSDDTHAQAIANEDIRHQQALDAINAQYDPQIAALNNEIAGFEAENARDTTKEIQDGQAELQRQYENLLKDDNNPAAGTDYTHQMHIRVYQENCDIYYNTTLPNLQKLQKDYQKLLDDRPLLASLNSQKQAAITGENSLHVSKLEAIA